MMLTNRQRRLKIIVYAMAVVTCSLLSEEGRAVTFRVQDSYTCRKLCVDKGYSYFSDYTGLQGVCCSQDDVATRSQECLQDGHNSQMHQTDQLKYFACPQGPGCGTRRMTSQKYSQKYRVQMSVLDGQSPFCHHEIAFGLDAGLGDVMKVEF